MLNFFDRLISVKGHFYTANHIITIKIKDLLACGYLMSVKLPFHKVFADSLLSG